ncbi:MAG: hypothetical protein WCI77_01955 [Candidatus Omnitrophota bacterium]
MITPKKTPLVIIGIRQNVSRWSGTIAASLLGLSVLLFIWMWARAYMHGDIPQTSWGQYEGNHGPWRHRYDLRGVWWQILNIQFCAFVFGLVSVVFKPSTRATIIVALTFAMGFLFFAMNYWLVD